MPPMFFGFYWFWPTELGVGLDYGKFPTILCPGIFSSNSTRPFSKAKSSSWRGRTKTPSRDNGEGTVDGRHSCTSWDANNQSQLGIIGCKIDELPSSPFCATARFLQLCFRNEFMVNCGETQGGMFNHSRHMRRKMFRFSELLLGCRFILGYVPCDSLTLFGMKLFQIHSRWAPYQLQVRLKTPFIAVITLVTHL